MIFMLLLILSFFSMEFVAWFTHKYIMHSFLWIWHKDHHKKQTKGFFEKNDYFFLVFAIPGFVCILLGTIFQVSYVLPIGIGITLYGLTYFTVHDIFIHQRIKWFRKTNHWYFKGIRRAHKIHHKSIEKNDGECFGMLVVPRKYFVK